MQSILRLHALRGVSITPPEYLGSEKWVVRVATDRTRTRRYHFSGIARGSVNPHVVQVSLIVEAEDLIGVGARQTMFFS